METQHLLSMLLAIILGIVGWFLKASMVRIDVLEKTKEQQGKKIAVLETKLDMTVERIEGKLKDLKEDTLEIKETLKQINKK